jgi:hypothetical protein
MVDMMMVFDEMNANPINWVLLLAILYLCWVILAPMPAAVRWVMMNECVTVALSSSRQHVCVLFVGVEWCHIRLHESWLHRPHLPRLSCETRAVTHGVSFVPSSITSVFAILYLIAKAHGCVVTDHLQLSQVLPAPAVKPPINP